MARSVETMMRHKAERLLASAAQITAEKEAALPLTHPSTLKAVVADNGFYKVVYEGSGRIPVALEGYFTSINVVNKLIAGYRGE